MDRQSQIIYMQLRLVRRAAREWRLSVAQASEVFARYGVFRYLADLFDLFHVEGDEAIWADVQTYLAHQKGQE